MLKLVSNKDGVEIHTLQIENGVATIEPEFDGIQELLQGLTDKRQILNALSQFNPDYVWAVTYEKPPLKPLTRRQFRLALVMNGFALADIEALINQIEDDMQRQIIQIEWQDATVFERNNSSLLTIAALMGLSSTQIDELWAQALTV
ncbi:hypothetical protein [Acinetobacter haemolyticus]|uniref:hypothetical protein n=1 Tax=Acinetobacter haemolyticus TaxID=29430 RepID=UPI00137292B4|nr:hypothetical protein [Acinetobacter haemolyticus]NAR56703.1 hypothetical protein [Acinetobacter haemolyticus]NAR91520.1 hypothetical protein [Acinetobacter haemolyticus]